MTKTQDLKPDIVLKNYWSNNEQFADIFNAVLFGGNQVIRPEELEDADTEESTVLEHRDYAESIKVSRDNIKISKKSAVYGVDKSVIMTVAGATNCRIDYNALDGRGDVDMCTLFEEIARDGQLEGEAKGIVEAGVDFGISEKDILERLQNKLEVSLQKAQEYLEMFGKQTIS